MEVLINCSNTSSTGSKIVDYSNDFSTYVKKIDSILDSINTAWSGDDSLKYINAMKDKYIVELEEIKKYLEDYGNYLKKVPNAYKTLDEAFSSKNIDV